MLRLKAALHRVRGLFRRRSLETEMNAELRAHLDALIERNVAAGMSLDEARLAAQRDFGGVAQIAERARDERRSAWLEHAGRDARFALRTLAKTPVMTLIAIVTLALGVGATTAIFGVLDAYILDPVPVPDQERLFEIKAVHRGTPFGLSAKLNQFLGEEREVFDLVVAHATDQRTVEGGEFLEFAWGRRVSRGFFSFFGAAPSLGRWITTEEENAGAEDLIVISHAWWQNRFGADPSVLGRPIRTDRGMLTIIGVMPPSFQFPSKNVHYWRLLRFQPNELAPRTARFFGNHATFARLAPAVSRERAAAYLAALPKRLAADFPRSDADATIVLRPVRDAFVAPELRNTVWTIAGAIGFVLLIVCANIAVLQLVRSESRLREMSVRFALGASRGRILQQLLVESVVLALLGGAAAALLGWWLRPLLESIVPAYAPALRSSELNFALLLGTFAVSAGCGIAFGFWPAWRVTDSRLGAHMKQASATVSVSRRQGWVRSGLIVLEVALAVVLLTGAGLMLRRVLDLLETDPGYDPRNLAHISFGTPRDAGAREKYPGFTAETARQLAALPGTTAVGLYVGGGSNSGIFVADGVKPDWVSQHHVGVGKLDFFGTIGAQLAAGRWFTELDGKPGEHGILINEAMAALCWPGREAVGQRLFSGDPAANERAAANYYEVVGVVRDWRDWSLVREVQPSIFLPATEDRSPRPEFFVRTTLDRASFASAARRINREVIPGTVEPSLWWLDETLYASTGTHRLCMAFLLAFGGVGLFLSLLGIFGVLNHSVLQRTREIGVRLAIGAQRGDIVGMVMRQGMTFVAVGVVVGGLAAFALTRLLRSLLADVSPTDPAAIAVAFALLALTALVACWIPARRAAKIDPMIALRAE